MDSHNLKKLKMDPSSSRNTTTSPWPNLPSDILTTIATLLTPKIGHLRFRSTCHPWRTTLSSSTAPPPPPQLPLSLPSPISPSDDPPLSLLPQTLYLLTPSPTTTFIIHLQQPPTTTTTTFTFINPISGKPSLKPIHHLNLLNYGITPVCNSHAAVNSTFFRKIVVSETVDGRVAVLGLTKEDGRLFLWKHGDKHWTEINHGVKLFDDIVSYRGKFFATADRRGRLVKIDPDGLKVIDIVARMMYGCGGPTSLVGSEAGLYLIDRIYENGNDLVRFEVFKLDEKGRFWDYEYDLNDCVFFLGDYANLSISRKDYNGNVRNVIYFVGVDDVIKVWDVGKSVICRLVDDEEYRSLFSPPSSWFDEM